MLTQQSPMCITHQNIIHNSLCYTQLHHKLSHCVCCYHPVTKVHHQGIALGFKHRSIINVSIMYHLWKQLSNERAWSLVCYYCTFLEVHVTTTMSILYMQLFSPTHSVEVIIYSANYRQYLKSLQVQE